MGEGRLSTEGHPAARQLCRVRMTVLWPGHALPLPLTPDSQALPSPGSARSGGPTGSPGQAMWGQVSVTSEAAAQPCDLPPRHGRH